MALNRRAPFCLAQDYRLSRYTIVFCNVESREITPQTKCSLRESLFAKTEPQIFQISAEFNTGLYQKLNTLTLADIRITASLAPLPHFKGTPLVQAIEPIAKQVQNFNLLNGQRGCIYSKQILLPMLTKLWVAH